jgi:seryl-tRNA synthetase
MNITNSINILELINKTYEFKNKITELIEQIKKYRECRNEFNELIEQIKKNYELKNKINKLQINNHTSHKESSNTINYSKSVIYKIEHIDSPELLYVGSTTDFIRRKSQHKHHCNNNISKEFNKKLYQMIRQNGGFNDFKIMIIKEFPCNSKTELLIEEEKHRKD